MSWRLPLAVVLAPAPPPPPQIVIETTAETYPALGLGFASFKGIPVFKAPWKPGGVIQQGIVRGTDERASWLIRTGPGEGLDRFLTEHEGWTVVPTLATVCGRQVPALIATHPEEHITCVITAEGNHPAYVPPQRILAVQYAHRGLPVMASFEIASDHLEQWHAVEATLVGGLRCL